MKNYLYIVVGILVWIAIFLLYIIFMQDHFFQSQQEILKKLDVVSQKVNDINDRLNQDFPIEIK